jgi:hypothetical protein
MLMLLSAPRIAGAQPAGSPAKEPDPRDFNDPSNHLFRRRGTAFHVNEWDLNMAGAYAKKKAPAPTGWDISASPTFRTSRRSARG